MRRAVLPLMLMALGCQSATQEFTDEQKTAVAQEVARAYDAYAAAIRTLDQGAAQRLFQQSDDLTLVENGTVTRSWTAMADLVRRTWPMFGSVKSFNWGRLDTQVLAPDVAVVTTTFDFDGTDTTGAPIVIKGIATHVWLRTAEGWKIVNGAETYPRPEASAQ